MTTPGWLSRCLADVPPGEGWLGPVERGVLRTLRTERRRSDWRLGRWTAKLAVGAWMSVAPESVEIVAAADGAPEAWLDGRRVPASVSISHRAGRALAAVGGAGALVGCDLELVEPRSDAFVREWLGQAEWEMLAARPEGERALMANLLWTAKEAAAEGPSRGAAAGCPQRRRGPGAGHGARRGVAGAEREVGGRLAPDVCVDAHRGDVRDVGRGGAGAATRPAS